MTWKEQIKAASDSLDTQAWLEGLGREWLPTVVQSYPVLITPYYRSLIDPHNPADPLLEIVAPSVNELNGRGLSDTMGEHQDYKIQGLQHRYPATALLLVNDFCASYCRF